MKKNKDEEKETLILAILAATFFVGILYVAAKLLF